MEMLHRILPLNRMKYFKIALNWLINSGLFYLGWVLTLKFVLNGMYWQGPLLNLVIVLIHLIRVPHRIFETILVITIPIIGMLFDSTLAYFGLLRYEGPYDCCSWLAPPWVNSLWALFATSINHSLAWAGKNLGIAVLTGAIGGTVSYLAAIKVGAVHFLVSDTVGIACLAVAWAIIFPLCYVYSRWLQKKVGIHV